MQQQGLMVLKINDSGMMLMARGQLADAEKVFTNCIEMFPSFLPAYYNRAIVRYKQRLLLQAKADIDYFIERTAPTGNLSGYSVLGDIMLEMDNYDEADRCYTLCLQESPLPSLYYRRFLTRSFAGQFSAGYEDLVEAGRLGSKDAINLLDKAPGWQGIKPEAPAAAINE